MSTWDPLDSRTPPEKSEGIPVLIVDDGPKKELDMIQMFDYHRG